MNKIAKLNDHARKTFTGCRLTATAGVSAMFPEDVAAVLQLVRGYDAFDPAGQEDGNDPHGEHDFGAFDYAHGPHGEKRTYFWKFDYYADTSYSAGAENPADPSTARVLTIMLASEY
jgi:hypothetical protein